MGVTCEGLPLVANVVGVVAITPSHVVIQGISAAQECFFRSKTGRSGGHFPRIGV